MSSDGDHPFKRLKLTQDGELGVPTLSGLDTPPPEDESDSSQESDYGGKESFRDAIDVIFSRALEEMERENSHWSNVQPSSSSTNSPEDFYYRHDLTFWRNGLIVDQRPLWKYTEQGIDTFIESLKNGVCPEAITPDNPNDTPPIRVRLRRRHARFRETPVAAEADAPLGVDRNTDDDSEELLTDLLFLTLPLPDPAAPPPPPPPSMSLVVDESLPSTSIQLRLADGNRITGRFNLHHTVGDIRSFIDESTPGSNRTYQLQTGEIPPRVLTDPTQTIEQADLVTSLVFQKYSTSVDQS